MLSTGQVVVGIQSIFWPSTAPKLLTRRMDFCFPLWLRKSSTWKCEWDCEHVLWRNLFPSWPFWTLPFFRRNKNRWHVGGVQYTFPNWHLQNRRWESIIFFFPEKRKLDEGRIQCVLKVACIFLWLSAFIPFPISKGWMFSSPGDRKCASLEWDGEHLSSLETAHPTGSPPTTQHNMGTEPCFSLLSMDSGKQTEQRTLLP